MSSFFSLDASTLEAQLKADLAAPRWPGARHQDPESGEAIGRAVGAAVLAQAAADNYLVTSPGTPPSGPGKWVSSPAAIVRSLHGQRLEGSEGTPALSIVAGYSQMEFARLMREGVPRDGRKLELMGDVARSRFVHFSDEEVGALYTYLSTQMTASKD